MSKRVSNVLINLPRNITPVNLEELRRVKQALVELESKADNYRCAVCSTPSFHPHPSGTDCPAAAHWTRSCNGAHSAVAAQPSQAQVQAAARPTMRLRYQRAVVGARQGHAGGADGRRGRGGGDEPEQPPGAGGAPPHARARAPGARHGEVRTRDPACAPRIPAARVVAGSPDTGSLVACMHLAVQHAGHERAAVR